MFGFGDFALYNNCVMCFTIVMVSFHIHDKILHVNVLISDSDE